MKGTADDTLFHLEWVLLEMARLQRLPLDRLQVKGALRSLKPNGNPLAQARQVITSAGLRAPTALSRPDPARLPLMAHVPSLGWVVVINRQPDGRWQVQSPGGAAVCSQHDLDGSCLLLQSGNSHDAATSASGRPHAESFSFAHIIRATMFSYRGAITEAVLASVLIGLLALMTSLFSMQVYDRVIPTRSEYTLAVLGAGVVLSILIELTLKFVRAHIMDRVAVGADHRLSREIFQRLLQLRVDQIPQSVGSLAGQIRGYEQVRNFYTAGTLFSVVDLPMGLVFLLVIAAIASPLVALVPLTMAIVALAVGMYARRRIARLAESSAVHSHQKTGLLVEAVEGVETIKSGSGGWRFLSRWLDLNQRTIGTDLSMRRNSEAISYFAAASQQLAYAGVVFVGALVVMQGHMTMGALIAASILCGRVLSPIMMIPGLFVQHAHARAALKGLNAIYALKSDNEGVQRVLVPQLLQGHLAVENAVFSYGMQTQLALRVEGLEIAPGEKVGVIGPIGAGKSTLLRLLSGLYVPREGRVLIDGMDMSHIRREVLNQHIGYLQQEHRLFEGTLRDNLLIGLPDPGDVVLNEVMKRTGMDRLVRSHPMGLDRQITEGGKGLSGGQRQLLALTRLLLAQPCIMMLDEPTANLDGAQEAQVVDVLRQEIDQEKTLILVTHKPELLQLVDRVIVVMGHKIALDGPKTDVLEKLHKAPRLHDTSATPAALRMHAASQASHSTPLPPTPIANQTTSQEAVAP